MRRPRASSFAVALLLALACHGSSGPGITLDVSPAPIQLVRNASVQLAVSALDGDGHLVTGVSVTFTALDTSIATVTNLGLVSAKTVLGSTAIRVTGGGAHRDVPVTVYAVPSYIILGPSDVLLSRGQTVQMHGTAYDSLNIPITSVSLSWESSDPLVASVSATGLVRAESSGTAFITARLSPVAATARVRVRGATAIIITPSDTSIGQGDSAGFRGRVVDQGGDSIPGLTLTWESSNTAVATISATGLARTVGSHSGLVTILARYGALVGQAQLLVRDTTILGNRVPLAGQPFGAAISATRVAYVTLGLASQLARTDLPSQAFAPAVAVGSTPTEVAFNSTGTRAYVANQLSDYVGVVDVATNTQFDTIRVTGDPFELIVQPGDSIIYVATNANQVYGIRLSTKAVVVSIPTGSVGDGMLIRDSLLYISTLFAGTIIEFNLRTRVVSRTFPVGGTPQKMAISPDGNTLYIANQGASNGAVQFWNRITGAQIGTNIPLPGAFGIALRPTNGLLYVTTAYSGRIYVIDPASGSVINAVIAGGSTRHVIFDANGVGFVPNENGWVDFIK